MVCACQGHGRGYPPAAKLQYESHHTQDKYTMKLDISDKAILRGREEST